MGLNRWSKSCHKTFRNFSSTQSIFNDTNLPNVLVNSMGKRLVNKCFLKLHQNWPPKNWDINMNSQVICIYFFPPVIFGQFVWKHVDKILFSEWKCKGTLKWNGWRWWNVGLGWLSSVNDWLKPRLRINHSCRNTVQQCTFANQSMQIDVLSGKSIIFKDHGQECIQSC